MQKYYYYDDSGKVVMSGHTPDISWVPNKEGLTLALGDAEVGSHYIQEGAVLSIPQPPNTFCTFCYLTHTWQVDQNKLLPMLLAATNTYLNAVAWDNGEWESIYNAVSAAAVPGPFQEQAGTLAAWWSEVWVAYYALTSAIADNPSLVPANEAAFIAQLPTYNT